MYIYFFLRHRMVENVLQFASGLNSALQVQQFCIKKKKSEIAPLFLMQLNMLKL